MKFIKGKTRCNISRSGRLGIVADNFVDKDVQCMLLPLNLLQHFFFCPKYRIKDNFIFPNSIRSCLMSLCGTIVFISFIFHRFYYPPIFSEQYRFDVGINYFQFIFSTIGFLINFFAVIFHSNENVTFVLKLLYIHRFLNNKTAFKHFIGGNWISAILIVGVGINFTIQICRSFKLPYNNILCGLFEISFDTNMVYAIRLIKLLKNKVDLWNIQTLNFHSLGDRDRVDYCKKIYQAFAYILECYDIYKVTFQKMIVFYCMSSFCNNLFHIQTALENDSESQTSAMWLINTWLAKTLLLETILSVEIENFYIAVNKVQDTCAVLLNSNSTDAERRLYKNIKRLHKTTFDKMDACGMFYVGATVTLQIMQLTTNYTIVLLQFALL